MLHLFYMQIIYCLDSQFINFSSCTINLNIMHLAEIKTIVFHEFIQIYWIFISITYKSLILFKYLHDQPLKPMCLIFDFIRCSHIDSINTVPNLIIIRLNQIDDCLLLNLIRINIHKLQFINQKSNINTINCLKYRMLQLKQMLLSPPL